MPKKGYKHSEGWKKRMSLIGKERGFGKWMTGRKLSEENKRKIIVSLIGRQVSKETRKKIGDAQRGEKNHSWKGDNVGYGGVHAWVKSILGKPNKCEHCGNTNAKKYEWANKSGKCKRDLNDWMRLCTKCHHKLDKINERVGEMLRGRAAWNKGKKCPNISRTLKEKGICPQLYSKRLCVVNI